jgi:hypothetical protein
MTHLSSPNAADLFCCHACGGQVVELAAPALRSLVGSDCTPAKGDVRIGVCGACGLLQKKISPAWSDLCARIYGNYRIYHQADGQEQKARSSEGGELKPRSELIAAFLSNAIKLPNNGAALDIGSGNGPFVRAMNKLLPGWSLTGSDVYDTFKEEIKKIGPHVSFRLTEELVTAGDTYDIVSLIHSIEHIPAPADYLADTKRYIKKTGVLLIEVPDAELNPFDLVVADHSSHFSKATLAAEVEAAGYEVLVCGNLVIGKEITLLARPLHDRPVSSRRVASPRAVEVAKRNLAWLDATLQCGERLAREAHPLGVFGTSIAGVWIGNALGNVLDFYTDEDALRVGRDCFGIPVIAPCAIPSGATVFVCLEPKLGAAIAARHTAPGRKFVFPPALTV